MLQYACNRSYTADCWSYVAREHFKRLLLWEVILRIIVVQIDERSIK